MHFLNFNGLEQVIIANIALSLHCITGSTVHMLELKIPYLLCQASHLPLLHDKFTAYIIGANLVETMQLDNDSSKILLPL